MPAATAANVLPPSVVRNLSDKLYERRKAAALEVERLVATAEPETLGKIVDRLVGYTRSANSNARKGGLLCLAATAVGLAGAGGGDGAAAGLPMALLGQLLSPVLEALRDPDARTRFYALEALYNVIRAARGSPALTSFFSEVRWRSAGGWTATPLPQLDC